MKIKKKKQLYQREVLFFSKINLKSRSLECFLGFWPFVCKKKYKACEKRNENAMT